CATRSSRRPTATTTSICVAPATQLRRAVAYAVATEPLIRFSVNRQFSAAGGQRSPNRLPDGAGAAARDELGALLLDVAGTLAVDLGEQPARHRASVARDVSGHRRERRVDDLADQRVVPRDDRDVVGDREPHLVRDAQAGHREHVAVEDDPGRRLWQRE